MSAFDYVYQELGIKCGLAWFATPAGIVAIVVSVVLALIGAVMANKWDRRDERRRNGWQD